MSKRALWPNLEAHDGFTYHDRENDPATTSRTKRRRRRKVDKTAWFNKPELLKLRDKWYKKLEKEGFRDIEFPLTHSGDVSDQFRVFSPDRMLMTNYSPVEFFAKQEYFELLSAYVRQLEEKYEKKLPGKPKKVELTVMQHVEQGVGRRDIAKIVRLTHWQVTCIVKRHIEAATASVRGTNVV